MKTVSENIDEWFLTRKRDPKKWIVSLTPTNAQKVIDELGDKLPTKGYDIKIVDECLGDMMMFKLKKEFEEHNVGLMYCPYKVVLKPSTNPVVYSEGIIASHALKLRPLDLVMMPSWENACVRYVPICRSLIKERLIKRLRKNNFKNKRKVLRNGIRSRKVL